MCIDTPLCPVGHLPRKGGECWGLSFLQNLSLCNRRNFIGKWLPLLISPLAGEMSDRTEGGEIVTPLNSQFEH